MAKREAPKKPHKDFPLTPHPNGQWCKKVQGTLYYFGPWDDPEGALREWLDRKDKILAGLDRPRADSGVPAADNITVGELVKLYLAARHTDVLKGRLSDETFGDYIRVLEHFTQFLGRGTKVAALKPVTFLTYRQTLEAGDYADATIARTIAYIKAMFHYADENELIPPIRFGTGFKKPKTADARQRRRQGERQHGKGVYSVDELKKVLEAAKPDSQMYAMVLLGINCALGPADIAHMTESVIDAETGRLDYPRRKTGIDREGYLWPITRDAIKSARAARPQPLEPADKDLIFLTRFGRRWVRAEREMTGDKITKVVRDSPLAKEYRKLLDSVKITRKGIDFYALRHTFRTWSDECQDQNAVRRCMGHELIGMDRHYVRHFELDRLKRVSDLVHAKLFGSGADDSKTGGTTARPDQTPAPNSADPGADAAAA